MSRGKIKLIYAQNLPSFKRRAYLFRGTLEVLTGTFKFTSCLIFDISFILINSSSTLLDNSSLLYLELAGKVRSVVQVHIKEKLKLLQMVRKCRNFLIVVL